MFGLKNEDIAYIRNLLSTVPAVEKALIVGSRAMGNYKAGSDVDIALCGDNINWNAVTHIHYELEEESHMPYFFDVVDYTHLEHKGFREHIEHYGKVIYQKKSNE